MFIGGISYEERYVRGYSLLRECGINPKEKVLFYFNEVLTTYNRAAEELKFDESFNLNETDKKLHTDLYDELNGLLSFKRYMQENQEKFEGKNIIIDLSVMVKPYFFLLVKHLSTMKTKRLGFIYTEPDHYEKLTQGTIATKDIPSFSGRQTLRKKQALVVLLGFEGTRAVAANNEINPELTIPINGFPSFQPKFKDLSILNNKDLLMDEEIFRNLRFAPASNPFETKIVLEELYKEYSDEYNITIAPLGSKPMALGACFFSIEHEESRVIYPYPLEYLPKSSKGWRKSWLYITEFENQLSENTSCPK